MDILELNEKKRLLRLKKRRKELREQNGILYYRPHKKQDMFHRAGKYKGRYARTGNRFGKSEMGAAEDVAFLLGYRPWYPEGDPARYEGIPKHPTKGLLIVTDWDKATEIFTNTFQGGEAGEEGDRRGKLFTLIPKNKIVGTPHRNHGGHIDRIQIQSIHNGVSVLYIDTQQAFKQNKMGAESSDWDFIHVDEPIMQKFWRAVSRGLIDRKGKYWFTCTPLNEMWINDHFIPPERLRDTFDEPYVNNRRWMITGSIFDNPFISKEDAIDFLNDSMDQAERDCREKGIPTALSGLIFKQFDPSSGGKHVRDFSTFKGWKGRHTPPQDYTLYVSIDPHPKTPHAALFCAVSPHEQKFVFAELFAPVLVKDLCSRMIHVLGGRRPARVVCDPLAWVPNPVTGVCMADEFYRCGFAVEPASKELEFGIMKTQEALEEEDSWYFEESLKQTRYEFDHYTWAEGKEKPVDEDDHMMECLRRLVMINPKWIDKNKNAGRVIQPTDFSSAPMTVPDAASMMRYDRAPDITRPPSHGFDDYEVPYTEVWGENRYR